MSVEGQKTILLADDDPIIATTAKMALEKGGYKVILADSGEGAVAAVEQNPGIDLILMDINLGTGMDGTEAAGIILRWHDIPVVFFSSHIEPEIVAKTEKITSYGYVVKHSGDAVLLASLRMAFRLFEAKQKETEKESALKTAEETYRNMFLNAQAGLFRTEIESGLLLDANDCLARFLGYKDRQELLAKPFNIAERYVDPQDRQRIISLLQEHGEFSNFEARLKRKDGSIAWLRYSSKLAPQKGWIEGVAEDITKEKAMEESLREGEERYRSILNASPDTIVITDMDGRIRMASPAALTLLGFGREEELLGRPLNDFLPPDDRERARTNLALMLQGVFTGPGEYHAIRADGSLIDIEANSELIRGADRQPASIVFIIRDISARKRSEKALAQERFLMQALMNNVPDYVYFKDRHSRFIRINKAHARLFAVSDPAQAVGKTDFDFFTEEHARQAFEDEQAIMRTGRPLSKEERETWSDRPDTWVMTTKMPLRDAKGNLIGTFGISRDITERKQAEEEIKRELAEKEVLLREVHHRIYNNIASIGGLLSLHLKSTRNPEAVAALQDAIGRIDSMRVLYDKLMLSETYKDVSVKNYVESLADLVIALFPGSPRVTIEKRIDDFPLDAKRLFALGIIINELLTNKMKYAFSDRDAGLIMVSLTKTDRQVTLAIQDDGTGLPNDSDAYEAKGFGLMMVKMLSRQLGGTFSMDKQAGACCTIEFTI